MEDIITEIVNIVGAVTNVQQVYNYLPPQVTVYPAVCIIPLSWESNYLDLRTANRDFIFTIRVIGHIVEGSEQSSQVTVRGIVKAIVDVLQNFNNVNLNNKCDYTRLETGEFKFTVAGATEYYCDIGFRVRTHFNR